MLLHCDLTNKDYEVKEVFLSIRELNAKYPKRRDTSIEIFIGFYPNLKIVRVYTSHKAPFEKYGVISNCKY